MVGDVVFGEPGEGELQAFVAAPGDEDDFVLGGEQAHKVDDDVDGLVEMDLVPVEGAALPHFGDGAVDVADDTGCFGHGDLLSAGLLPGNGCLTRMARLDTIIEVPTF